MKRAWKISRRLLVGALLTFSGISCNKNVLEQFADKGTDAAIYYSAQQQMNARRYTAAIATLGTLSAGYLAQRSVQFTLASAYAGRCGLDFIPLANALTNMSTSTSIMDVLLSQLTSVAGTADCETAETILRALSPNNSGVFTDTDEALQMATIAMAKVGAILAISTGAHAGSQNVAFNGCTVTASSATTTGLTDADTDQIGTGLTLAYNNLQVNTSFASAITSMTTMCLQFISLGDDVCAKTTTGFSAQELKAIRGLVNYNPVGIGTDTTYTFCP